MAFAKQKNIIVRMKHIKRSSVKSYEETSNKHFSENATRNNSCLMSPKHNKYSKSVLLSKSNSDSKN